MTQADLLFFMELHLMESLPERLSEDKRIMDDSPDLFVLTVSGLKVRIHLAQVSET